MQVLFYGLYSADAAIGLARVVLGLFFVLARFRWFYDPSKPKGGRLFSDIRRESLAAKMDHCGYGKSYRLAAFVATIEVLAGLGVLFGFLTVLSAIGLACILVVAMVCISYDKTMRQNPVDRVDVVSCWLWTPEPVYLVLALGIVVSGPGAYSIDAALMSWFGW